MNSSYYKTCVVPYCKSTTIKTPEKLFIYVPNNKKMRKLWLELARREDADHLSTESRMYFCEDHFDLPNDMANYMKYHIMGTVSQVRMKSGCIPTKFECQVDREKRTSVDEERPYIVKKRRRGTLTERLNESHRNKVNTNDSMDTISNLQPVGNVLQILCEPDLSVQTCMTHEARSIATRIVKIIDQELPPVNTVEAALGKKQCEGENQVQEQQMAQNYNVSKKLLRREQIDFVTEVEIKQEPNDYVTQEVLKREQNEFIAEVQQEENDSITEIQQEQIDFVTEVDIKQEPGEYVTEKQLQHQQNECVTKEEPEEQNDYETEEEPQQVQNDYLTQEELKQERDDCLTEEELKQEQNDHLTEEGLQQDVNDCVADEESKQEQNEQGQGEQNDYVTEDEPSVFMLQLECNVNNKTSQIWTSSEDILKKSMGNVKVIRFPLNIECSVKEEGQDSSRPSTSTANSGILMKCKFSRMHFFEVWTKLRGNAREKYKKIRVKFKDNIQNDNLDLVPLEKRVNTLCKSFEEFWKSENRTDITLLRKYADWLSGIECIELKGNYENSYTKGNGINQRSISNTYSGGRQTKINILNHRHLTESSEIESPTVNTSDKSNSCSKISPNEVLSLFEKAKLSKHQYLLIKEFINDKMDSHILPTYDSVLEAKNKSCPEDILTESKIKA